MRSTTMLKRLGELGGRLCRAAASSVCNRFGTPILVLCYHRVARLESDPWGLAVTPEHFREQMQWVSARFRVLRFEEDWSAAREPAVVVTFDDGYADNLYEALPILEEAAVPATFFVSTGLIGTTHEFWWDEIERLALNAPDSARPAAFQLADPEYGGMFATDSPGARELLARRLGVLLKRVDPARRDGIVSQLRLWAGSGDQGRPSHRLLSVEDLKLLAASPLATIGAHTVSHPALARLDATGQRGEILRSRRQIESWLAKPVTVFSYPYGAREAFDSTSATICRRAGFRRAAAGWPGLAYTWTDPFLIPRAFVLNWDQGRFERMIAENFGLINHRSA